MSTVLVLLLTLAFRLYCMLWRLFEGQRYCHSVRDAFWWYLLLLKDLRFEASRLPVQFGV